MSEKTVTIDEETAITCLRELNILIKETGGEDAENPMTPIARVRQEVLENLDKTNYVIWVVDEVGRETGAETNPDVDPLTGDIFKARRDLENALEEADL